MTHHGGGFHLTSPAASFLLEKHLILAHFYSTGITICIGIILVGNIIHITILVIVVHVFKIKIQSKSLKLSIFNGIRQRHAVCPVSH